MDLANGSATDGGNVIVEEGDLTITNSTVYLGVADHGGGPLRDSDPRPAGPLTLWDQGAFEAQ